MNQRRGVKLCLQNVAVIWALVVVWFFLRGNRTHRTNLNTIGDPSRQDNLSKQPQLAHEIHSPKNRLADENQVEVTHVVNEQVQHDTLSITQPYLVEFEVQLLEGIRTFVMEVYPKWAPLGAARFKQLLDSNFFAGLRFFRVAPGFMVQFGISGDPKVNAKWSGDAIQDDPVLQHNAPYTVSFACNGKDTRTTQMFINYITSEEMLAKPGWRQDDLDQQGFAPFAKVVSGMSVVDHINAQYGESPRQGEIQTEGNSYLQANFPDLSYIKSTRLL